MRNKDLIKKLSMFDPDAICTFVSDSYGMDTRFYQIKNVEQDEGIFNEEWSGSGPDNGYYDCLTEWKNVKEMEDFYGSTDSDPLAFVSLIVLN